MATEQLLLSAVGSPDNWILVAGSTKVVACQTPDDDATSYIRSGTTANTEQRFTLADPADIGAGDTINFVTVRIRHQRASTPAGNIQSSLTVGASTTYGTAVATGVSFADQSIQYDDVPGGTGWTLSNLNDLIAGVRNTLARDVHCTTIEVIVDYTPGSVETEETAQANRVETISATPDLVADQAAALAEEQGIDVVGSWVVDETLYDPMP